MRCAINYCFFIRFLKKKNKLKALFSEYLKFYFVYCLVIEPVICKPFFGIVFDLLTAYIPIQYSPKSISILSIHLIELILIEKPGKQKKDST